MELVLPMVTKRNPFFCHPGPGTGLGLGASLRKELTVLTGIFHPDSPQLDRVEKYLDEHEAEIVVVINKTHAGEELSLEDSAFLRDYPDILLGEW